VTSRLARGITAVVLAALLASCSSGGGGAADAFRGIVVTPGRSVAKVSLPDATDGNRDVAMEAEPGHVLLVYFGYTSCPDVCPTTLSDLREALHDDRVAPDAGRVDLAMVTIDPARDTGEVLTSYVRSFVPGAHALRTDDDARLRAAADAFGAQYSVTVPPDGGEEEVSHSGFVYAVDDRGDVVAQWSFGTTPDDLAHDLRWLLDGKEPVALTVP